jgi:hypothetical protein
MKIGVLIPTRKDRPKFLTQCNFLLSQQTLKPNIIEFVDFEPKDNEIDITLRYRIGCEKLFNENKCDLVCFWEDDDWYSKNYIKTIVDYWSKNKPNLIGFGKTIYYHLFSKNYTILNHPKKASACCSAVTKKILDINFPSDNYPYLDMEIWKQIPNREVINIDEFLHLGIKHNIGKVGGGGHPPNWSKYEKNDNDFMFLKSIVDEKSYNFYKNF